MAWGSILNNIRSRARYQPVMPSLVQPSVLGKPSSRGTSLCANARAAPARIWDWLPPFGDYGRFHKRTSFVKRMYHWFSCLIPFMMKFQNNQKAWLRSDRHENRSWLATAIPATTIHNTAAHAKYQITCCIPVITTGIERSQKTLRLACMSIARSRLPVRS
jgi:hypothetical protein